MYGGGGRKGEGVKQCLAAILLIYLVFCPPILPSCTSRKEALSARMSLIQAEIT
jgi:hypothetical protein